MNHHADKVREPVGGREAALVDAALGGVVAETHGCPGCGHVESRPCEPANRTISRSAQ